MKRLAPLLLAGFLLAPGPALAQDRERFMRQEMQPRERDRRESLSRERPAPRERHQDRRFTPEEREKLRQDLLDANREMRGRRGRR
jgi:Ni/Co efflux regulator RcnB